MVATVSLAILQLGGQSQGVLRLVAGTYAKAWSVLAAFGRNDKLLGPPWYTLKVRMSNGYVSARSSCNGKENHWEVKRKRY